MIRLDRGMLAVIDIGGAGHPSDRRILRRKRKRIVPPRLMNASGAWRPASRAKGKCNGVQHALPSRRAIAYGPGMEQMPHILVVDDDREIRDLLARFLETPPLARHRRRAMAARRGGPGPNGHYHLVVLDLMLPGEGGLDLARWMRGQSDVPIVMLTAMGEETDRIIGLELGADDYVRQAVQSARAAGPHPRRAAPRRATPAEPRTKPGARRCGSAAGRWSRRAAACSTPRASRSR